MHLNTSILDGNPCQQGLDYGGYLQILLCLTNSDTKYRRMTHLMEKNIRLIPEYAGFQMKYCIYGVQAKFYCELGRFGIHDTQTALSY